MFGHLSKHTFKRTYRNVHAFKYRGQMEPAITKIETSPKKTTCDHCGKEIEIGTIYWRRFCNDNCRQAFHRKAASVGKSVLKEQLRAEREQDFKDPF